MPSPYGKSEEDPTVEKDPIDMTIKQGVCGGDTRMQVFARLTDLERHVGITIKADVDDDDPGRRLLDRLVRRSQLARA